MEVQVRSPQPSYHPTIQLYDESRNCRTRPEYGVLIVQPDLGKNSPCDTHTFSFQSESKIFVIVPLNNPLQFSTVEKKIAEDFPVLTSAGECVEVKRMRKFLNF